MNRLKKLKKARQGYEGQYEQKLDGSFCGRVLMSTDLVLFQGDTINELRQNFNDAVDAYLTDCFENNKTPDTPVPFVEPVHHLLCLSFEVANYGGNKPSIAQTLAGATLPDGIAEVSRIKQAAFEAIWVIFECDSEHLKQAFLNNLPTFFGYATLVPDKDWAEFL